VHRKCRVTFLVSDISPETFRRNGPVINGSSVAPGALAKGISGWTRAAVT
jgi:hypothetical protein